MKWRQLLWPFSLLYSCIMGIRNLAFKYEVLNSRSFPLPVIAIGNLSTGGTGKTPMAEFILRNFIDQKPAVISRGYGRKTKGLQIATLNSSVEEIGDEPFQIFHKFQTVPVILSEKRVAGIETAIKDYNPGFIVLDDALQHRYVNPSFTILLTTFHQPYFNDYVLPAGNLRELRTGVKRANIVVVTKCPDDLSQSQAEKFTSKIKCRHIFFSTVRYGETQNSSKLKLPKGSKVFAVTGIARANLFIKEVQKHFDLKEHLNYPDHHNFSTKDISSISQKLKDDKGLSVITTEKDWVRLANKLPSPLLDRIYFIPIELDILFDKSHKFKELVNNHLQNFPQ